LIKQVVTERRALRDTIRAEKTIDEAAIRAQAAKVASLEADLAVQRAHVAHEIRAVLTPGQLQKLKDMQTDADARIDGFLHRIANRIAED
jgi:protein CpxP